MTIKDIYTLESTVDEELFLESEQYLLTHPVLKVIKEKKQLYLCTVREDERLLEIEIQIKANGLHQYTCECNREEFCKHLIVALFAIRTLLIEKKAERARAKRAPRVKRITTKDFLESVPKHQLYDFLSQYASKNKKFGILLKTKFLRNVLTETHPKDYDTILNTIIGPIRTTDQKMNSADLRMYMTVVEELLLQFDDAISLNQFKEASYIAVSCLRKHSYILKYATSFRDKLITINRDLHKRIEDLIRSKMAPAMQNRFTREILEIFTLSYYDVWDPKWNTLEILYRNPQYSEYQKDLRDLLITKCRLPNSSVSTKAYILGFLYRIISDNPDEELSELVTELESKSEINSLLLKNLNELEEYDHLIKAIKNLMEYDQSVSLKKSLLSALIKQENKKEFEKLSATYYLATLDKQILKMMLAAGIDYSRAIKKHKLYSSPEKIRRSLLNYHYESNQPKKLFKLIKDDCTLEELQRYDQILVEQTEELEQLYSQTISTHIEQTLGVASIKKLIQALYHVKSDLSQHKMCRALLQNIHDNFSHRKNLIKELNEAF